MKMYAYKIITDSLIHILQCKGNAEEIMKMASPDDVSGAGTEGDPYVYTATAEFIGELSKDANGEYILPDRKYRDLYKDDLAGGIEVIQADMDAKDRGDKLQAIRDYRVPLLEESDKEMNKHIDADANKIGLESDWKDYRTDLRNATDVYKDGSGDPTASIDPVDDPATDVTWPTKPS